MFWRTESFCSRTTTEELTLRCFVETLKVVVDEFGFKGSSGVEHVVVVVDWMAYHR